MSKPRLLDLFCGAGGAAMGYHRAGFNVLGVDIAPQKRYPFAFVQADALDYLAGLIQSGDIHQIAAIHASPPCQGYSHSRYIQGKQHPRLLEPMRTRLQAAGLPWVMENVAEAPMPSFLLLCGTQFGLKVYRHRQFESSELLMSPGRCHHPVALLPGYVCIAGGKAKGHQTGNTGNQFERVTPEYAKRAMGVEWMTLGEACQAIPPAFTEYLGRQLMTALGAIAA